ncbi:MAG: O-antigen ligase family protein [Patescibacteria group bacterium]
MNYLIVLTILLTPAYAIRFNIFGLSTNLLMLWVFFVWVIFTFYLTVNNEWAKYIEFKLSLDKKILAFISLFFAAALISLFWQGFSQEKLGQFIVLFIQPISLFIIASYTWYKNPDSKPLILNTCYLLLATMGLFAIIQYFTLLGLPPEYWGNSMEPKRVIAFFSHPNFYALFIAPLLAFLIPDAFSAISNFSAKGGQISKLWKPICWTIGAIGLLLSLSRAGWLGLGVAGLVYLFFAADRAIKKIASVVVIVMVIVIVSVPNLRWRFVLPFYGEKSAVSRLSLWETGWKGVKESPILGLGLTGFSNNWNKLNTDPNLDTHNYPHNIFLNLWVETGIIGLMSLIGLIGPLIYRGLRSVSSSLRGEGQGGGDAIKLGVALFLIALLSQGLLDNPYFKNDLAMVFWIVLSLGF